MKHKGILPLTLVTGLGLSFPATINAQKNSHPNIIILTADDLGWNDISSSLGTDGRGSKNHQTPNIDKFFNESTVFTRSYAQQNSAPSRAALLTGQYANRTKVYNVGSLSRQLEGADSTMIIPPQQRENIDSSTITIAESLKNAGYDTYIFGKIHGWAGDLDKNHGFNHDYSCSRIVKLPEAKEETQYFAVQKPSGEWTFDSPKFSKYANPYTSEYIKKELVPFANGNNPFIMEGKTKHLTDAMADCVKDRIKEAKDNKKPFFMWVCFNAIHSTIASRDDLYEKYKARTMLDPRHKNYKYAALTEQLDQTVGRILAALDDPNGDGDKSDSMRDSTIVIFMSDNGGVEEKRLIDEETHVVGAKNSHLNSPLRGAKGMLYEGGTRVPFAIRYPGKIKEGVAVQEPIHVIDYYPTLIELANAKLPTPKKHLLDGESFAKIVLGKTNHLDRTSIYWHFPGYLDVRLTPSSVINKRIGDKRYKLHYFYETKKYELYCLSNDEVEKVNLLEVSPNTEAIKIAKDLRKDLVNWLSKTDPLKMKWRDTHEYVGFPVEIQ